jgi:alpha-beta hydrolase superfamily lysophospholipase
MLAAVSKKSWAKNIRKDLPILIMSGDMDPVGNYGKGAKKVYDRLAAAGVCDVTVRLYDEGRHELFNEINKEVVIKNTLDWIESKLPGAEISEN